MIPFGVSLKPTWVWLVCYGVEPHVPNLISEIKIQCHIPVLCWVMIGVLMYYPACDSPRSFIEADMGLVGMLLDRTMCTSP